MDIDSENIVRPQSSRRTRACRQCRAAKVRCSGSRPCQRCTRRRDKCAFPSDEAHVLVPERYLHELQREIAELKSRSNTIPTASNELTDWRGTTSLSDADPSSVITPRSLDRPTTSARMTEIDPPGPFSPSPITRRHDDVGCTSAANGPATRDEHASGVPQAYNPLVAKDIAYISGSDERRLLFLGHTSTWSFCRRVFTLLEDTALHSNRAPLNLDGAAFRLHWQPKNEVDSNDLVKLPPIDHALLLYNTVKFRLGELFCIVDEKSFLQLFDKFHQNPLEIVQANRIWFVEYLMILAFGKAFTTYADNTTATAPPGSELAIRALALLPDVAFLQDDRPALLAMEVSALIALYFQSIDMRSPAYQYIGQALRLCFHDGLHRKLPEDITQPDMTSHSSNLWWTIYVLDQSLSAGLGCPSTMPLNSITTPLPDTQSDTMPTKALALRTRLAQINSMIYNTIYGFDDSLGSDFVSCITSVLHKLAEVSRDIDEVVSSFKASKGELPRMFHSISLSHHHSIIIATRPLVIWLLMRRLPPSEFDPRMLSGPIARLLEKSVQSATATILILINLLDRDMLETFLPFQLEYAFSSAILLSILGAILPTCIPDSGWHSAVLSVFDEMIKRGNIVAKLRKSELEHLEVILDPYRTQTSTTPFHTSAAAESRTIADTTTQQNRSFNLLGDHDHASSTIDWSGSDDIFYPFDTDAEDILALAEQLQHDDFSFSV